MTHARALSLVFVLAATTFACASTTSPPPQEDTSDLTQDKSATSDPKTAPAAPAAPAATKSADTKPADKPPVTPAAEKPATPTNGDVATTLRDCLTKCNDLDCARQCIEAAEPSLPGNGGEGRGGDAMCCVGSQLWVCHATGQNGASCDANQTPPGDNCEKMANDGSCQ